MPRTVPRTPRSRVTKSIAPTLKSLHIAFKESWAQRPEAAGQPRGRSASRESSASTSTRAASLEKLQTGSIKSYVSRVGKYQVENEVGNEEKGEESSWSDTENEGVKLKKVGG